ncbi:ADP-ribosyltransferase [Adhaeribacter radiodurans]|uniref:ADP ribosyltransferase domain-containing protein n=1 Tax=Adhaeribacter radiodurans TaxID=2745197 RepID=A0A7L7L2K2_9BACT|nr:ADP-ribosyltransferase [Adhaeribacter radiodurans]QMU26679.1 hypothetical protein HUW48_00925 [Adhaeribacter radiodurans]
MSQDELEALTKFIKSVDLSNRTNLAGQFARHKDPLKASIDCYVNHGYNRINPYLRTKNRIKDSSSEAFIKYLNIALDSCPKMSSTTLFRMESSTQPNWYVKKWFNERSGKTIIYPAFTSSSQEKVRVNHTSILFEITTSVDSNAHNIDDNGGKKCEMEALYRNNTSFKILSTTGDRYKILIKLEEVKEEKGITIYDNILYHRLNHKNRLGENERLSLIDLDI